MSRLLDEALPLDAAGRSDWLDRLAPEHRDLVPHLRSALLPEESQAAELKSLSTLPRLGTLGEDSPVAASGLQSHARVGPYELIRLLGAGGMAEVWLARRADGAFNREVALKLPLLTNLRADLEQRFGSGYIAYVSTGGGRRGIWKLERGTATELWDDVGSDRAGAPAIAPDGRHIAFTVENQDGKKLYVNDSDGGRARVIGTALDLRGALAWGPDSQSIVGAIVRNGEPRLATIFLDGKPPQPLVSEYSLDAAWSPDGKYLVYSGADVGTTFPLRASGRDGRPYGMASLILSSPICRQSLRSATSTLPQMGRKSFSIVCRILRISRCSSVHIKG